MSKTQTLSKTRAQRRFRSRVFASLQSSVRFTEPLLRRFTVHSITWKEGKITLARELRCRKPLDVGFAGAFKWKKADLHAANL